MSKLLFMDVPGLNTEMTLQTRLIFVHPCGEFFITSQLPDYLF